MPKAEKPRQSVEGYMAGLAPEAAQILGRIRAVMRKVAPDVVESISYDILKFSYGGTYLYAGGWKKHVGLYPIYPAAPALEAEIAPYRKKTDTVQFVYARPVPYDLIEKIARERIGKG